MNTEYDTWLWSAITVLNRKRVFEMKNYNMYKANFTTAFK